MCHTGRHTQGRGRGSVLTVLLHPGLKLTNQGEPEDGQRDGRSGAPPPPEAVELGEKSELDAKRGER